MKKNKILVTNIILVMVILGGCVSDGSSRIKFHENPPDWFLSPPQDDDTYMYFTGLGASTKRNLDQAEELAIQDLIAAIMRYIGVTITSQTSADARSTLDEFNVSLSKQVTETGSSRVAGFKVMEKWVQRNEDGITVYILARYAKEDILREKTRIQELFEETVNAIAVPEKEGDDFARKGNYYDAAIHYLQAAVAASETELENASIAFNRNIDNAMNAIEKLNILKLNDNITGFAGEELSQPFGMKVVLGGSSLSAPGVPNVSLKVSYKIGTGSGRKKVESVVIKTDSDGVVTFVHPIPNFVGTEKVTVNLDLYAYLEKLENTAPAYASKVEALNMLVLNKKISFEITVMSRAKSIPSGILIVDLDDSNQVIADSQVTASGVLESLTALGFTIKIIQLNPALLVGKNDTEIVTLFKELSNDIERAIYGTATIISYYLDSGQYLFTVRGTVKVVDIKSGTILFEKTIKKSAIGVNIESARSAAFKILGKEMGKAIATESP